MKTQSELCVRQSSQSCVQIRKVRRTDVNGDIQKIKTTNFSEFKVSIAIMGGTKKGKSMRANEMIDFSKLKIQDEDSSKIYGFFPSSTESITIVDTCYAYSPKIQDNTFSYSDLYPIKNNQEYKYLIQDCQLHNVPINSENLRKLETMHIGIKAQINERSQSLHKKSQQAIIKAAQAMNSPQTMVIKSNLKIFQNQFLSQHCAIIDNPGFEDNSTRYFNRKNLIYSYSQEKIIIFCVDPDRGSIDSQSFNQLLHHYETENPDNVYLSINVSHVNYNIRRKIEKLDNLYYSSFILVPRELKILFIELMERLKNLEISDFDRIQKLLSKIEVIQNFSKMHDQIYQTQKMQFKNQADKIAILKKYYLDKSKQQQLRKIIEIYPFDLINFHGFSFLTFMDPQYQAIHANDPLRLLKEISKKKEQTYLASRTMHILNEQFIKIQIQCEKVQQQLIHRQKIMSLQEAQKRHHQKFRIEVMKETAQLYKKLKQKFVQFKLTIIHQFKLFKQFLTKQRVTRHDFKTIYILRSTVQQDIQKQISQKLNNIVKFSLEREKLLVKECKQAIDKTYSKFKDNSDAQKKTILDFESLVRNYVITETQQTVSQIEKNIKINKNLGDMFGLKLYVKSIRPALVSGSLILTTQILPTIVAQSALTVFRIIALSTISIGVTFTAGCFAAEHIYKRKKDKQFLLDIQNFNKYTLTAEKTVDDFINKLNKQRDLSLDLQYLSTYHKFHIMQPQKAISQILDQIKLERKRLSLNYKTHVQSSFL